MSGPYLKKALVLFEIVFATNFKDNALIGEDSDNIKKGNLTISD
jgi:hypothetical protein